MIRRIADSGVGRRALLLRDFRPDLVHVELLGLADQRLERFGRQLMLIVLAEGIGTFLVVTAFVSVPPVSTMSSVRMQFFPSTSPITFITSATFGAGRRLSMIARGASLICLAKALARAEAIAKAQQYMQSSGAELTQEKFIPANLKTVSFTTDSNLVISGARPTDGQTITTYVAKLTPAGEVPALDLKGGARLH